MSKIAIRIDDVCENMDWQSFNRFADILDKYNIKPLIGVVPFNQDEMLEGEIREDFHSWLQTRIAEGWTIALHGYNHLYSTKEGGVFPLNDFSEFAGVPYDKQLEMLTKGNERLELMGISSQIFMAPAHSFDNNTIKALKSLGYVYITDGFGSRPYQIDGVTYLPISFKKSSELKKSGGYTTFVYHTATMNDKDFADFEKFVINYRQSIINYDELMKVPVIRRSAIYGLGVRMKATAKRMLVRLKG